MFNSTRINLSIPEQETKLVPYTRVERRENVKKDIDNVQEITNNIQCNIVSKQANETNIELDEYSFYINGNFRDINMSVAFKINNKEVEASATIDRYDELGYILINFNHNNKNKNMTEKLISALNKKINSLIDDAISASNNQD